MQTNTSKLIQEAKKLYKIIYVVDNYTPMDVIRYMQLCYELNAKGYTIDERDDEVIFKIPNYIYVKEFKEYSCVKCMFFDPIGISPLCRHPNGDNSEYCVENHVICKKK